MAIAILASNQINGDPLTGTCFTGLYDTHTLKLFVLGTVPLSSLLYAHLYVLCVLTSTFYWPLRVRTYAQG